MLDSWPNLAVNKDWFDTDRYPHGRERLMLYLQGNSVTLDDHDPSVLKRKGTRND